MPTEKNFRHGHRDRVRARFLREGLFAFADYEVLELLLFYAIPRRDTKEQAHALDDTMGSLYHALTASETQLCRIQGIGARTASFLRALLPFLEYVAKEEPHEEACHDNFTLAKRIYPHVEKNGTDSSLLVFLSNSDEIICVHPLEGEDCLTSITSAQIIELSYSYHASSIVPVDYKGSGIPFPSDASMQGMQSLRYELSKVGIHVRDYLVFTDTQYNSLFFLLGDRHFQSPSPFFLGQDAPKTPAFQEKSAKKLKDILSLVTTAEKAEAFTTSALKKYSTLSTLLALPYETLLAEGKDLGIDALFLKILYEVHSRASLSRIRTERAIYKNAHEIGSMLSDAIGLNSDEIIALAMFNKEMRLIDVAICGKGSVNTASFVMRNIVQTALSHKAAYVALAHNHPNGTTVPSIVDTSSTSAAASAFRQTNIQFIDQFIVTSSEYSCISRLGHSGVTDMPDEFFEK